MTPESVSPAVTGELFLISTPIGNLDDMTIRGIDTLKQCSVVFAEDTRRTLVLFRKFDIHARLASYHAFNEHGKTHEVISRVLAGEKVGLVTDAGTPCVADPGFLLVREAVKAGINPVVIPGVSSLTFAIAASGLPSERFTFYGFLPVKSGRRAARIAEIAAENKSVVIFESPYRLGKLLRELSEALGPDTACAVVREATKLHEEVLRGPLGELVASTADRVWKGECVVVVSARNAEPSADSENEAENLP